MIHNLYILAAGDETIGKVVFGIIAVIIWAISAASKSMKAQREQRERIQRLDATLKAPPPMIPQQPAALYSSAARQKSAAAHRAKRPFAREAAALREAAAKREAQLQAARKQQQLTVPLPPARAGTAPIRSVPQPPPQQQRAASTRPIVGSASQRSSSVPPRLPSANARTLHQWLKPGTMQSQFVLTEIFQPPIALRPPTTPGI